MIHSYLSVQGFYMKTQEWPMSSRLVERFDNWEVLSWWRCSHLTLRIYSCIANGKSKPGAHEHTFEVIRNESVTRTNLHTSCAMWNSAMGASTCIYPAPRPKERSTGCTYSTSQICTKFDNFAWRSHVIHLSVKWFGHHVCWHLFREVILLLEDINVTTPWK